MFKIKSITAATGLVAAVFGFVLPAEAEIDINTIINYYDITGTSGKELKRQMKERGPNGFWAYTHWNVRWSSECELGLIINYTYPRLKNRNSISFPVRNRFSDMMELLMLHEHGHGQHGIEAAREIKAAGCKDANNIVKKWARQDEIYDEKTRHGKEQGVSLQD